METAEELRDYFITLGPMILASLEGDRKTLSEGPRGEGSEQGPRDGLVRSDLA